VSREASATPPPNLPLHCPVCGGRLQESLRTFRCPDGHAFDLAREGYLNLLPDGHGRSRRSGDTAEMLAARSRFLGQGHFDPLVGEVTRALLAEAMRVCDGRKTPFTVLDAGCGEGHYLAAAAGALAEVRAGMDPGSRRHAAPGSAVRGDARHLLMGFDLSREAVRRAARAVPSGFFFVNDVGHRICVASEGVDLILDIFAPRNPREFARVLRPGGALLVVLPGENHLREVRGRLPILEIEPEKREKTLARLTPGLQFEGERTVRHTAELGGDDLRDLVHMSPSHWHVTPEELDSMDQGEPLQVTVSCLLLCFRKPIFPDLGEAAGSG